MDHFPRFLIAGTEKRMSPEGKVQITKRLINKTNEIFKNSLQEITWDNQISSRETDSADRAFLKKFFFLYDKASENFLATIKLKTMKSPW